MKVLSFVIVFLSIFNLVIVSAETHKELWKKAQSQPRSISSLFSQIKSNQFDRHSNDKLIQVNDKIQLLLEESQNTYRFSFDQGETWTASLPNKNKLHLKYSTFDPVELTLKGKEYHLKSKFKNYLSSVSSSNALETLIVQFHGQVIEEYQRVIKSLGGQVLFYLPDNSLVVSLNNNVNKNDLSSLPYVRWVGPYLAEYKISELTMIEIEKLLSNKDSISIKLNVMLLERGEKAQELVRKVIEERIGGKVTHNIPQGFRLEVVVYTMKQIIQIAQLPQVMYMDLWSEPSNDMDVARLSGGIEYVSKVSGYNGERIRAEVFDSGLYLNHGDFVSNPPILHGPNCASTSHGTSVFGIVFGDGTGNARALGSLPNHEAGIFACYSALTNRYNHTQELVDPQGKYRTVFQTNSWGDSQTTEYTSISAEMDDIIFDTDLLILQSQSNTGSTRSRPQAWSKNILSVGAFYHYATISRSDDAWASGASIGFAEDGRRKPDLSHFYDEILTTSSTGPRDYTSFGGTSGATPITAGHFGIMFQMWADGVFFGRKGANNDPFEARPHSSTSKALMINTAEQFPFDEQTTDLKRQHQGWGVSDVGTLHDSAKRGNWRLPILVDESSPILPLQTLSFSVLVLNSRRSSYLKVSLVYRDPMPLVSASKQLINDLDLIVTSPSGEVYYGNHGLNQSPCSSPGGESEDIDNVENVFVCNAINGEWTITVVGTNIVQDSYPETPAIDAIFSLVATLGR